MKAVIQRVTRASVEVSGETVGAIDNGLVILLGIAKGDTCAHAEYLLNKIIQLRIFEDEAGLFNKSLLDIQGELLIVSQFTLCADCRKGRRPSFVDAAPTHEAKQLYDFFLEKAREFKIKVASGIFQAMMLVKIENNGPVTICLEK
ncbi:MAG: D-aminoacyl-tRNA deacylase [bacterium]